MSDKTKLFTARLKVIGWMLLDALIMNLGVFLSIIFIYYGESNTAELLKTALLLSPVMALVTALIFYFVRGYRIIWKYAGAKDVYRLFAATVLVEFVYFGCNELVTRTGMLGDLERLNLRIYPVALVFALAMLSLYRLMLRQYGKQAKKGSGEVSDKSSKAERVLVVGGGDGGAMIIKDLKQSETFEIVGIVDDSPEKQGQSIYGVNVLGTRNNIPEIVCKQKIDTILFCIPTCAPADRVEILGICAKTGCQVKVLPGFTQLIGGRIDQSLLRKVEIEDLLERDPIRIDNDSVLDYVKGKCVLVTGGGGSIGSELCRQIASHAPKTLIIFDIYENNAYAIQNELKRLHPHLDLQVLIGSVRDEKRLEDLFSEFRPQIVFHAAAHKHVPLMEDSPKEAIKNNVFGTLNTVRMADAYETERFVLISTDKAVNPTNVMGTTKRVCEMIVQTYNERSDTEYVAVRFGNVLGSNGSVVPLFKEQIANGGPVTVTHPDIIRYFMTIPEAVSLVLQAGAFAKGGEIFVLDMGKPVRILDMAEKLIRLSGYEPYTEMRIEFSGLRPGEKLYEELLMDEEGLGSTENNLIHIGQPIKLAPDFLERLERLRQELQEEDFDPRKALMEIVPTYRPKKD
jgi:FlaA1/EpsC-like NDP-sugar epimerase